MNLWLIQRTPTNRADFIIWLNHHGELALGALDRLDFDSFDFFRVEAGHLISQF
jgi:hypothetical protein